MATRVHEVEVSGPNMEGRGVPNEGAGISLAVYHATRQPTGTGTWYVRHTGVVVRRVELHEDGVVTIEGVS